MASLGLIGMVGGIGEGMVKQADREIEAAARSKFETWRMEVLQGYKKQDEARAEGRTIAAEGRKVAAADKARTDQVLRVEAKTGEIADAAVGRKRGLVESGIADPNAWTTDQQATVDQSLTLDRKSAAADPETRIKAGIATGDISPEKAATIERDERRLDATERKTAAAERTAEMRDATQRYIAELRDKQQGARLEALIAKTGKDKDGVKEALSFLDGARKELTSEENNLKSLYQAELKEARFPEDRAQVKSGYEPKLAGVRQKREQLEADYMALRARVGLPPPLGSGPAAVPAGAAPIQPSPSGKPASKDYSHLWRGKP